MSTNRVLALVLTALVFVMALVAFHNAYSNDSPATTLPACQYEDSTHCYWDASERGNGKGNDFINP